MSDGRKTAVILVEDHEMVRDAMVAALAVHDDIALVDAVNSVGAATEAISRGRADVVVTDLELGDGTGTELVAMCQTLDPPPAVLLITGTDEQEGIQQALAAGCAGFVSKADGFDTLVDAIHIAARGGAVFPAALLNTALASPSSTATNVAGLTEREIEVLQLLAEARTTTEIAEHLYLSPHTVRNHIKQVLAKLGAHSQLEAVVIGARTGIVTID